MQDTIREYSLKKNGENELSTNFKVKEFACKDGSDKVVISKQLVGALQNLRFEIKKPIHIISGYRTQEYNIKCGGANNSYHLLGRACDIKVDGINIYELAMLCVRVGFKGVIVYPTKQFIHVDTRDNTYYKVEV